MSSNPENADHLLQAIGENVEAVRRIEGAEARQVDIETRMKMLHEEEARIQQFRAESSSQVLQYTDSCESKGPCPIPSHLVCCPSFSIDWSAVAGSKGDCRQGTSAAGVGDKPPSRRKGTQAGKGKLECASQGIEAECII